VCGFGYGGRGLERDMFGDRYATIANSEAASDAPRNAVVNHNVAYPYVSTRKMNGFSSAISPKNGFSTCTGYACSPHVAVAIATTIAITVRAWTTARNMPALLRNY
jgi:hypothetical protein